MIVFREVVDRVKFLQVEGALRWGIWDSGQRQVRLAIRRGPQLLDSFIVTEGKWKEQVMVPIKMATMTNHNRDLLKDYRVPGFVLNTL